MHIFHLLIHPAGCVFSLPASQALRASASLAAENALRTGLAQLDEALVSPGRELPSSTPLSDIRGIQRGHITEVYGPPAVGKTALGLVPCGHSDTAIETMHRNL
jgi:RecA/RadA recombinase